MKTGGLIGGINPSEGNSVDAVVRGVEEEGRFNATVGGKKRPEVDAIDRDILAICTLAASRRDHSKAGSLPEPLPIICLPASRDVSALL